MFSWNLGKYEFIFGVQTKNTGGSTRYFKKNGYRLPALARSKLAPANDTVGGAESGAIAAARMGERLAAHVGHGADRFSPWPPHASGLCRRDEHGEW
eukprot:1417280-Rhodomonas_salina.1